jgi:tetratricopeptide (TPR) repeat protein
MLRIAMLLVLVPLAGGIARAQVTAETLARLEARREARPNDARVLRDLGVALFKLKRFADARTVLADAARYNPRDAVTALYLGMSAEEQNDLPAARQAYVNYLSTGRTRSTRDAVSQRLAALTQRELKAQATAAVAQEQRLAAQPGAATTIAVLPLRVSGPAGAQYEPLGRGLAELMISDFAKVPNLRLVERARIQAILDEIALGRSNQVDGATAVRSGRLVQAGQIVTGALTIPSPANAQLNTSVVRMSAPNTPQAGGSQAGALNAIFDAEKQVVLQTLQAMNITVSPEVRTAIAGNRPTTNLQAFLAYSRGLVSSDAGRLDEAVSFFDNARALDPGFAIAAQQAATARAAAAGQNMTTANIESTLRGSSEGQVVAAVERGATGGSATDALASTLQNVLADVNPSTADAIGRPVTAVSARDAQSSSTSTDGGATPRLGTILVIIRRP